MLVSLSIKNWLSFRDKATLSMLASREKQHGNRVAKVKKYGIKILPVAVLFGPNASGKSNFVRAIEFTKWLLSDDRKIEDGIKMQQFMLDEDTAREPSCFEFVILVKEQLYEYSFAVDTKSIHWEQLIKINTASEHFVFERSGKDIKMGKKYSKCKELENTSIKSPQLCLTTQQFRKFDIFKNIHDWFASLGIVTPDHVYQSHQQFMNTDHPMHEMMNSLLFSLDTGISSIGSVIEKIANISNEDKARLHADLDDKGDIPVVKREYLAKQPRVVLTRDGSEPAVKKLVFYHKDKSGRDVAFQSFHESDGTNRLLDVLPAFIDTVTTSGNNGTKFYAIDEVDRSLHTKLVITLLASYLHGCTATSRTQLLVTTHNLLLMDQDIFRRDEMWLTEKQSDGASTIYSFSDYEDVRYDKDLRRSYLQGRLGGMPLIAEEDVFEACRTATYF